MALIRAMSILTARRQAAARHTASASAAWGQQGGGCAAAPPLQHGVDLIVQRALHALALPLVDEAAERGGGGAVLLRDAGRQRQRLRKISRSIS